MPFIPSKSRDLADENNKILTEWKWFETTVFERTWWTLSGRGLQHYVIKFVSDLRQVGRWFSPGPPVSSTNKTDRHDITEILLKVVLNTIKQTNIQCSWKQTENSRSMQDATRSRIIFSFLNAVIVEDESGYCRRWKRLL
jgi:hypothetical protein